jgi:hypothetical protein
VRMGSKGKKLCSIYVTLNVKLCASACHLPSPRMCRDAEFGKESAPSSSVNAPMVKYLSISAGPWQKNIVCFYVSSTGYSDRRRFGCFVFLSGKHRHVLFLLLYLFLLFTFCTFFFLLLLLPDGDWGTDWPCRSCGCCSFGLDCCCG